MNYFNLSFLFVLLSCSSVTSDKNSFMKNYNFKDPQQVKISSKLNEISGLANSNDGNLYAISDEIGIIYKLNPINGKIIKRFFLGKWTAEADFEGIAASAKYIYAISSDGNLYQFEEGENEQAVDYEIIKLPFSSKFDIEGLFYDKELNGLLIISKEYAGKKNKHQRAIYLYSLKTFEIEKNPIITISLNVLGKDFKVKDFYPSGITKHPKTGNYLVISAKGDNVIVEIDSLGNIIGTQKLRENIHRQPEGITVLADYTLLISDEAAGKRPTLTIYNFKD
jgi:uncharacterized protein YjiK